MARQKKKALKAREQLFDVEEEEEEEEQEEEAGGREDRGSEKRSGGGGKSGGARGGADSDSEDEDKDGGVWAENEKEAMMGPGDEAKVTKHHLLFRVTCVVDVCCGGSPFRLVYWRPAIRNKTRLLCVPGVEV